MRIGTSGKLKRDAVILVVLMVLYAGAAWFVSNSYFQLILTLVPIWAAFGVSWNILSGRERWDVESISDPLPGYYSWTELVRELSHLVGRRVREARCRKIARSPRSYSTTISSTCARI